MNRADETDEPHCSLSIPFTERHGKSFSRWRTYTALPSLFSPYPMYGCDLVPIVRWGGGWLWWRFNLILATWLQTDEYL
jgi:hypothetical protein